MEPNPTDVVEKFTGLFKKGYKTSEFWIVAVVGCYLAAYQVIDPSKSLKEQAPALSLAALGFIYTLSRTGLKTRRLGILPLLASIAATVQDNLVDGTEDTEGDPAVDPDTIPMPPDPAVATVTPTPPTFPYSTKDVR